MKNLCLMAVMLSFPSKGFCQMVVASWYDQPGLTASGSRYDPRKLTAAHRTLPFGTMVSLKKGDRTVTVEITDRGPFVKGRQFDLSKAAAKRLGVKGVENIEILKISRSQNDRRKTRNISPNSGKIHSGGSRPGNKKRKLTE